MSTISNRGSDPFQVIEEALGQFSFQATNPYLADEALTALASLREEWERMGRQERRLGLALAEERSIDWRVRAEKAEAERDALTRTLATYSEEDSWADLEHARAENQRLREALGKIEAKDRAGHDSEVAADMGYIARRALGEGS